MLRRIAPKSLWGRTILIVVLPIFLMQSVVTFVFFNRHWEDVNGALARQTSNEIAHILALWRDPPIGMTQAAVERMARQDLDLYMRWAPGQSIPDRDKLTFFSELTRSLNDAMAEAVDEPVWINTRGYADEVEVRVQLPEGYLVFISPRDQVAATNAPIFVLWLIGTSLLLGYVAVVFMRNQVRSITRLADAADAFGRGEDIPHFRPAGAREVRQAGQAFLAMRARIRRYLHQRTAMLAGVSHDLRTPLTRLKLGIAMLPDNEDRKALDADAQEMERMLEAYLDFVRDAQDAERSSIDVKALASELADEAKRLGQTLEIDIEDDVVIHASPVAIKRALNNLISNGFAHGDHVRLTARTNHRTVTLRVEDDGPGIGAEDRERALQPFERLDPSRNTQGTGLGLSVVVDITKRHGGHFELGDAELGGLSATLKLPA
ncbi:MAG: ATP-binding protein [Pseudomonadota bacterium]